MKFSSLEELKKVNASVLGFCDSGKEKHGQVIQGCEIFGIERMIEMYKNENCYIVVANRAAIVEIINMLHENDINNIAIIT